VQGGLMLPKYFPLGLLSMQHSLQPLMLRTLLAYG